MKRKLYFFALLFIGILITSCEKSDLDYEQDFEQSYNEWLSFKKISGDSYRYMVIGGSVFGPGWQTTITVTNGKVTQRHFKYTSVNGFTIPQEALEWTENEREINSHEFGASALTLDQIYEKARNEWLIKRKNAKTYFEHYNGNLISSCGYVEDGCMDDCFTGINIAYIVSL